MEKSSNKNNLLDPHSPEKKRNNYTKSKKKTKKKVPSTLSNDALLEQILAKKVSRKSKQRNPLPKEQISRSNEEILEEILLKKRRKQQAKNKHKGKIVSKEQVSATIVANVIEGYPKEESDLKEKLIYQDIFLALKEQEKDSKKNKKHSKLLPFLIGGGSLVLIALLFSILFCVIKKNSFRFHAPEEIDITYDNRPLLVEDCMQEAISLGDNLVIQQKAREVDAYLSQTYNASVSYETSDYLYLYRSDILYYAASTIKALDALYIYTYASIGTINLDTTMTYSSKYQRKSSKGLSSYAYGSQVTLRDLVKYAIIYSDNSAHIMLLEYIGEKNLRDFGVSIGVLHALSFSDPFGYLSSWDGLSIMRGVRQFIKTNEELGLELQSYFLAAEQNDLEIPSLGIKAAHKYGEYGSVYHDMGIVYDTYPYLVAIFTSEGNKKNKEDIIRDIHSRIYDLHQTIYSEKEALCKARIYK